MQTSTRVRRDEQEYEWEIENFNVVFIINSKSNRNEKKHWKISKNEYKNAIAINAIMKV